MLIRNRKPSKKIRHKFVTYMPPKGELEDDVVYISIDFKTLLHKCACGCGSEISTPLTPDDWTLIYDGDTVSLSPSIGNWSYPCESHYFIKNDMFVWADKWSDAKIKRMRILQKQEREKHQK